VRVSAVSAIASKIVASTGRSPGRRVPLNVNQHGSSPAAAVPEIGRPRPYPTRTSAPGGAEFWTRWHPRRLRHYG